MFQESTPKTFWQYKANQKRFFDWLMIQLGYECMDDWYNVTGKDIHMNGGGGLLMRYNDSPSVALQSIYPGHNWDLQKFKKKPTRFWQHKHNQRKYFDQLMIQLDYKCMNDWYDVTVEDIHKNGGVGLLNLYNGSPSIAIQSVYPEHTWILQNFHKKKRRSRNANIELQQSKVQELVAEVQSDINMDNLCS